MKKEVKKCPDHPLYRGKGEPSKMCRPCWRYYIDQILQRKAQRDREEYYNSLRQTPRPR